MLRDADHLGTTRVVTNASGAVVSRTDFKPFGEQIAVVGGTPRVNVAGYSADSGVSLKFTGQVRDASIQDYFGARYFSGYQGRFTSPDVPLLDQNPLDPQSWNLYSYGRNNPLANTDPTGNCSVKHEGQPASDDPGEPCVEKSDTTVEVTARAPQRDYSWSDLTFNWVRGNTRRIESFTENDKYTQQLRDRRLIRSKVAAAKTLAARCNPQFPAGDVSERLGNYPKGYRTGKFLTDGFDFAFNPGNPNTAASSLGSFRMSYRTTRFSASTGTATVAFSIINPKTFSSATRNPASGYRGAGNRRPSWLGSMMQDLTEIISWDEVFDFPGCPAN